jgi:hypothetical protein
MFYIIAIIAAIFAMPASAQSLREQLVGAWAVVSCNPNAPLARTCGTNPNGILILDASGRYAMVIALRDRPRAFAPRGEIAAETIGELARGLTAQFGTWSANEEKKTYMTHIDGALFPNVEGVEGIATVRISGDDLKFVAADGGQTVFRRISK